MERNRAKALKSICKMHILNYDMDKNIYLVLSAISSYNTK